MNNQNQFKGFTPEALQFLRDIRFYNSKSWYEEQKQNYRQLLLIPFQQLVSDLSGFMLSIDSQFITIPAIDKTISRIYRDTRFSKDKSLYRDSMWLTFKRPTAEWKDVPAYFFEITPNRYRYGMGFYSAPKVFMDKFKERIKSKPSRFLETVAFLNQNSHFVVEGERYKKNPVNSFPKELREWFQYKSFYITSNHNLDDELLFGEELVRKLADGFGLLAPLYSYLWEMS